MTKRNLEASIDIEAPPEQVWQALGNLTRMPEWSPQCARMYMLGRLREGVYTLNWNRQGGKGWPSASKVVAVKPPRHIAFRTVTNNTVWSFDILATSAGCWVTHRRTVPPQGTARVSAAIVKLFLGGEEHFDEETLDGMKTTLANIKATVERQPSQTSSC